jgi:Cu2+-exporting ATPase
MIDEARATVEALRDRGVHVMLLTGDLPAAAQRIAAAVGMQIGDIQAGLAPEAKCAVLERRRHGLRRGGDGR